MINNKRVCIFVDGENLRHSIGDLFPSFNIRDYLPKKAEWAKFFDWVTCLVAGNDAERIRTYWYVVENIDFSPYNLNSARKDNDKNIVKNILSRDEKIKNEIKTISDKDKSKLDEFIKNKVDELLLIQEEMRGRFSGWIAIQDMIEKNNKSIEFRRAGAIRYNLFTRALGSEKAVDIKLATDLIRLKDIYDIAIIVSGDQDYVPAVDAIKDAGKHAVNVAFLTENNRLLPGGAKRLSQSTDWGIEIGHSDFKKYLGI